MYRQLRTVISYQYRTEKKPTLLSSVFLALIYNIQCTPAGVIYTFSSYNIYIYLFYMFKQKAYKDKALVVLRGEVNILHNIQYSICKEMPFDILHLYNWIKRKTKHVKGKQNSYKHVRNFIRGYQIWKERIILEIKQNVHRYYVSTNYSVFSLKVELHKYNLYIDVFFCLAYALRMLSLWAYV